MVGARSGEKAFVAERVGAEARRAAMATGARRPRLHEPSSALRGSGGFGLRQAGHADGRL